MGWKALYWRFQHLNSNQDMSHIPTQRFCQLDLLAGDITHETGYLPVQRLHPVNQLCMVFAHAGHHAFGYGVQLVAQATLNSL